MPILWGLIRFYVILYEFFLIFFMKCIDKYKKSVLQFGYNKTKNILKDYIMKSLIIGTQAVEFTIINNEFYTTTLDVAKIFNKLHYNILRIINQDIEFFNALTIEGVKYKDKKGETRKYYLLSQEAFSLLVMGFRGKQAMQWKVEYIKAFKLLRDEYFKTQNKLINENDKDLALEHTLPFDPKNTISKVNGLKRDKLVRSYYRSKNGKELKLLDKAIANLKTSLFGYDEDMLIELIDRRNELVAQRNEFIDLIS